jgi:pSer/pThr/pTyr-binding forkhead associated (FHA) protein
MTIKLKVLHGQLQNSRGANAGTEVRVRGPVFVIGSDADCSMCCRSKSISPHHCEIRLEDQGPVVRDLYSSSGTFVNDERIDYERVLQAGDRLRIGRLEFTVVIEQFSAPTVNERLRSQRTKPDAVAEYISNLLVEEDEKERVQRFEDPGKRQYHVEKSAPAAQQAQKDKDSPEGAAPKKAVRPVKKPPAKLPAPPPMSAGSTVEAAEETLNKIFFKGKR